MATFALIHGGGDVGRYWHLVERELCFFPPGFLRRVVAERLGVVADEIAGGHCVALGHPAEPADLVAGYGARPEAERSQWLVRASRSR